VPFTFVVKNGLEELGRHGRECRGRYQGREGVNVSSAEPQFRARMTDAGGVVAAFGRIASEVLETQAKQALVDGDSANRCRQ